MADEYNSAHTGAEIDAGITKAATVETNADVTDTANVTAAGALMDSEVAADLKTFALPANLTISTFAKTVLDDADAAAMRATLGILDAVLSIAVADLADQATPSVLTTAETTNKIISNYKSSGADHVFTMPAAHVNGNVVFVIGDEFQVDIEPDSGDLFYLNGTAMAADEHIQNTADTLGDQVAGYCANINGTLRWMFTSSDAEWVEETP